MNTLPKFSYQKIADTSTIPTIYIRDTISYQQTHREIDNGNRKQRRTKFKELKNGIKK